MSVWFINRDGFFVSESPADEMPVSPPPIHITRLEINEQQVDTSAGLDFPYDQNNCTISFLGISFKDENAIRYQYRLMPLEREWSQPKRQRSVTYAALQPGAYTFEVRATNADGGLSAEPARLGFAIKPPFWATWWFRVSVLLSLGLILTALHQYRIAKLREIERVRSRIAEDLHDEIASSLASVRMYSEVVQRQIRDQSPEARKLLGRIHELSGDVMKGVKHIIWAIDPRHDKLPELLSYIQQQGKQIFSAADISFTAKWPERVKSQSLSPDQRRAVYLILKEGMTNILRHARSTQVKLSCLQRGNELEFHLQDDGVGFDTGAQNNGHGLANMQKRAESIGARLQIHSQAKKGTDLNLRVKIV